MIVKPVKPVKLVNGPPGVSEPASLQAAIADAEAGTLHFLSVEDKPTGTGFGSWQKHQQAQRADV